MCRNQSDIDPVASSREVGARRALIEALSADVDRQLASAEGRSRDIQTRAGVIIAAAGIIVTLGVSEHITVGWFTFAVWAAGLGAFLGVVVLIPRLGQEIRISDEESRLWNEGDTVALRDLMYARLAVLKDIEQGLVWRAWVVSGGFALLAISVMAGVFAATFG